MRCSIERFQRIELKLSWYDHSFYERVPVSLVSCRRKRASRETTNLIYPRAARCPPRRLDVVEMKILVFHQQEPPEPGFRALFDGNEFEPFFHSAEGPALASFRTESPPLAVIDGRVGLPAAIHFLERIRDLARQSGTGLLALMESGSSQAVDQLLEAGADDCLTAPIDSQSLLVRAKVLEHKQRDRRAIWQAGKSTTRPNPTAIGKFIRERTGESLLWFRPDDRTLFERMPVGLYRTTPSGEILDANPALVAILAAPDRESLQSARAGDLYFDAEDRDRWKELILREGVLRDFEVRLRRLDGTIIWAKLSAQTFRGADGEILYYEGSLEDITDRKLAEAALRRSEERFRSMVQNASDMIAVLDSQGTVVYESPSHERYLGYPAEARIGRKSTDLVHPEDLAKAKALLSSLLAREKDVVSGEFRLRHADGSWRVVSCTGTNLLENPAVGGLVINSHDITERHNAEEALRSSEERFRSLVQNASDLVSIVDARGKLLYASPPHQRLLGYNPRSAKGARLADLLAAEDWERVQKTLAELSRDPGAVVTFEARVRGRDKQWKFLRTTCTNLIDNPAVGGIVLNSHDITKSKLGEEALRESEERFRLLSTAAFEGIIIHDQNKIVEANRTAAELFGYQPGQMIGLGKPSLVTPEFREAVSHSLREGDRKGMEVMGLRRDGGQFPVELVERPIPFRGRTMTVAAIRDITERLRAERELRESEEKHANLFRYSNDAILVHDLNGGLLDVNQRALDQFGFESREVLGLKVQDLVLPEFQASYRESMDALISTGFVSFEIEFQKRGGETFAAEVSASLFEIGGQRVAQEIVRDATERIRSEQALRESEERYRGLFEGVPLGLYRIAPDGRLLDVNLVLVEMLGYPDRETLLKISTTDLYVQPAMRLEWQRQMEKQGQVRDFECQIRRFDGSVIWSRSSASAVHGASGDLQHYEGAVEDITDRKEAIEALRRKEERFQSLVQNAPDMIAIIDGDGAILYESPSYERVLGRPSEERIGKSSFDFVHPEDLPSLKAALDELVGEPGKTMTVEHRALHADETWRVLEATATNLLDNPAVQGIVVNSRDVTDRKRAVDQLLHGALYDPLTGLPNRALLIDRLERSVAACRQHPDRHFAVLFLDLDQFKIINDSLGHTIGDRLLVQIGLALKTVLRSSDTIARLGGDEFVMLLDDVREEQHAIRVAERIHDILKTPFHIGGHEIFTTTSIGVAFSRPNIAGPEDLLRDADTAMYRAKAQGRACHVVFDPVMHETALNWLRLETDLRRAVKNQEFTLLYQPIISLPARELAGFEALVRWNHPERGTISPVEFIPIAEETGLIIPLGRFVLRQACGQFDTWRTNGQNRSPLMISVNISNRQFFHSDLPSDLAEVLRETGMDPRYLALEITEGVLVHDADLAARRFEQLKQMQVQLFLDDFGTGYSSLSYLHRFPIDTLKIDRSFVTNLHKGTENRDIVHAILTLGASLGVRVVAEGVETLEQAEELTRLGCELCQGFLFSRPVGSDEATRFVKSRPRIPGSEPFPAPNSSSQ